MTLDREHRSQLLALARQSVEQGLLAQRWVAMPQVEMPAELLHHRSSFVTLRIGKQLRGCCGNLVASHPVAEDVWRNAWASAFADPRFSPLENDEWPDVHVHVSVLSPLEPVSVADEADLIERLRPGIDGLVLERDDSRATFLPDVWEQISDPVDFVRHLKQKAGWPAHSWSERIRVQRYTTESFGEHDATSHTAAGVSCGG